MHLTLKVPPGASFGERDDPDIMNVFKLAVQRTLL